MRQTADSGESPIKLKMLQLALSYCNSPQASAAPTT